MTWSLVTSLQYIVLCRPAGEAQQGGHSADHGPVPVPGMWQNLPGKIFTQKTGENIKEKKSYQDTAAKFGSPQHSPLYTPPTGAEPVTFKKGDKCEWRILATHGEKIILNITSLDIPASANCHLDYLEVI